MPCLAVRGESRDLSTSSDWVSVPLYSRTLAISFALGGSSLTASHISAVVVMTDSLVVDIMESNWLTVKMPLIYSVTIFYVTLLLIMNS